MDELLVCLERRIKDLIEQQNRLQSSNYQLNNKKSMLLREREVLISRYQHAIAKIESLIAKLKVIEKQL